MCVMKENFSVISLLGLVKTLLNFMMLSTDTDVHWAT
jgi:hypothetical protein